MSAPRVWLLASLVALALLYAAWFRQEPAALVVFGLPQAVLALLVRRGSPRAGFFAGVLALLWFSHGVMVAWTRVPERGYALGAVVLAVAIVWFASLPGLRARFGARRK